MDIIRGTIAAPEGANLTYAQAGSGHDVLLLHGALTALEDMVIALFPTLSERWRVTAFDRPGHGDSGRAGPTGSPWRQAELIHSAVRELGLHRPMILGHSFGGAVALAYALQYPEETSAVVAVSPIAFPELRLEHFLFAPRATPFAGPVLSRVAQTTIDPLLLPILWRAMFLPQAMPENFRLAFPFDAAGDASRTEATGEDAVLMAPGLARSAMNYPFCRVPVHVMVGDEDKVINPALHGAALARLLPNATFERLEGLGHMVHHFAQSRVVAAVERLQPPDVAAAAA
jgi:pimeloyl-ACP methyl ester carboxylesterase